MTRINDALLRLFLWARAPLDERGEEAQTLAEYSLIITVIAVAIVGIALVLFRDALGDAFRAAGACLDGNCSTP